MNKFGMHVKFTAVSGSRDSLARILLEAADSLKPWVNVSYILFISLIPNKIVIVYGLQRYGAIQKPTPHP
ncbi:hypothetical protein D3C72_2014460 [compost metagenome]